MRNIQTFVKDISNKPPLLFPFVAVFHVLAFIYTAWAMRDVALVEVGLITSLWMLAYTIFWVGICDLRRWAALSYLGITALNLVLRYVMKPSVAHDLYTSTLFPLDVIFCFFILFFYKRFQ